MNQHMQQLAQATQQNTHTQNGLHNLTYKVTNLQNQLNSAPKPTQQHPGYQYVVEWEEERCSVDFAS